MRFCSVRKGNGVLNVVDQLLRVESMTDFLSIPFSLLSSPSPQPPWPYPCPCSPWVILMLTIPRLHYCYSTMTFPLFPSYTGFVVASSFAPHTHTNTNTHSFPLVPSLCLYALFSFTLARMAIRTFLYVCSIFLPLCHRAITKPHGNFVSPPTI